MSFKIFPATEFRNGPNNTNTLSRHGFIENAKHKAISRRLFLSSMVSLHGVAIGESKAILIILENFIIKWIVGISLL